jgi:tyrosyl-tRNA synthetase
MGHEVIFLIGDFTGMIGDPTDKAATRTKLTREAVLDNAKSYKEQASGYLDFSGENPAQVKYNSEWCDKLTFRDLIEVSSNFTVQQMMQRDMFQKRIQDEKPIHLHEFLYPLAQGYDSLALDVDLEIGGNDQMFNMMCGRDLMKAEGKKEKFVLTMKLLADENGKKMGKSEGNAVFLDGEPNDIFGAIMSWTDGSIIPAFELATRVPMEEVAKMAEGMANGANPRDYKLKLAKEIVRINCGEEAAVKAEEHFINTFSKKEIPDEMPELHPSNPDILTVLVEAGFCSSKSDARRQVEQKGVHIGGTAVESVEHQVKTGDIVQKGKRFFVRIV